MVPLHILIPRLERQALVRWIFGGYELESMDTGSELWSMALYLGGGW